jgi:hypothetical protein
MAELIFSIKNIFNDTSSDGCLYQYEAEKYHIPSYQRGYKWASKDDNDPVPILLNDLINAYSNSPKKKYYLQYITVTRRDNMLEVIDGQQRLTTLSIILSVFHLLLEDKENLAKNKLHYAIRPQVFENNIYPKEKLLQFLQQEWVKEKGITLENVQINNQDIFYLHSASKKIKSFFDKIIAEKGISYFQEFIKFFLDNVMIIVNIVESHIPGEKIFRNLNSKRVPLTEVDLIKGLLLTKVARVHENNGKRKHFREIMEIRSSLGRKWDEMYVYTNEPEFSSYFFTEGNGFYSLLELLAIGRGYKISSAEKHYPLFNFFNTQVENIHDVFSELILHFEILKNWYQNDVIYNLLGYAFTFNNYHFKAKFIHEYIMADYTKLKKELLNLRNKKLNTNPSTLKYGEHDADIKDVLLALSVFPENAQSYRFDFYSFSKHDWTLEHIFPQSPEGKGRILNIEQKEIIYEMLGGRENVDRKIIEILDNPERNDEEKKFYYEALKSIGPLNEIGNMCFLSHGINASIGCGFFNEKRSAILKHIREGKYVPLHSFDVFSKTILAENPGNLLAWDRNDIFNHTVCITGRIAKLKVEEAI